MAFTRARAALLSGLAALAASAAALTAVGSAEATAPAAPAAGEAPTAPIVEDLVHPGSERIFTEQKILLKKGDGNIILVACGGTVDIQVKTRTGQQDFCFDVKGARGRLELELPDAFGIFTEALPVKATITADGKETVVNAPANDYTVFGEAGTSEKRSVLVELAVGGPYAEGVKP